MTVSLDEICTLLRLQLGIANVTALDLIQANLGADSVDLVNIAATVEEKYQVEIAESDLARVRTVADLHKLVQQLTTL